MKKIFGGVAVFFQMSPFFDYSRFSRLLTAGRKSQRPPIFSNVLFFDYNVFSVLLTFWPENPIATENFKCLFLFAMNAFPDY